MMFQYVRFLCLLWKCLVKRAAGSGTALDGCLPPIFFFSLLLREKNTDCFILLTEQSDTLLSLF